jgi:hypothetical protein
MPNNVTQNKEVFMSEFHHNEEYASKAVAGTGLGFGIAGTALSLLNGNNNGGLGGILGNGRDQQSQISQLQAENAMLKSENYSDKVAKEVYAQSRADDKDIIESWIKPMASKIAANEVAMARQEEQINCLKETQRLREEILTQKIDAVACASNTGLVALQGTVNCLVQTVAGITKTIVPATAICPAPMPALNAWVAPTNA